MANINITNQDAMKHTKVYNGAGMNIIFYLELEQ